MINDEYIDENEMIPDEYIQDLREWSQSENKIVQNDLENGKNGIRYLSELKRSRMMAMRIPVKAASRTDVMSTTVPVISSSGERETLQCVD